MDTRRLIMVATVAVALAGCSSAPKKSPELELALAQQCSKGLDVGYQELNFSNAKGFGGSWEYTKAASLLGAAKVQSGFGSYDGCLEKVTTARAYIKASKNQ